MADSKFGSKVRTKRIPSESVVRLKDRLVSLPERSSERPQIIQEMADFYGVSKDKIYRSLKELDHPSHQYRADRGQPRRVSMEEMKLYCEVIAAFKLRTLNKKGRHISTTGVIEILEEFGVNTPNGPVKIEVV